jgi:DNA-binding NarL/FixJ family response regulator
MQKDAVGTSVPSEGFLLLDSSMNPIFVNLVATQILVYPEKADAQKNLNSYLANKIRSKLFLQPGSTGPALVPRFQSGRRTYWCRSFNVNSMANGHSHVSLAVLFGRASAAKSASLAQLSERFHLTAREQEVAQFLLQGLTSKEIGLRMQISPNTVKAFLHLIMVKMGVSTRSGIVGKAFSMEL